MDSANLTISGRATVEPKECGSKTKFIRFNVAVNSKSKKSGKEYVDYFTVKIFNTKMFDYVKQNVLVGSPVIVSGIPKYDAPWIGKGDKEMSGGISILSQRLNVYPKFEKVSKKK